MIHPTHAQMAFALACACSTGIASASTDRTLWADPFGDARLRRTDAGADGTLIPGGNLPDILSASVFPWQPLNPATDPYTGLPVSPEDAAIVRFDVVFAGLVNPPGPLGLNGADFAPDHFGPSPVYGFIEFDVDRDRDTGGEDTGPAKSRTLATAARFGGRIADPVLIDRLPTSAAELDTNWTTAPYFERTGTDFAIALCGCYDAIIVSQTGNGDDKFDAGETMTVRGRFFQRSGGYAEASWMLGGSAFGQYDPIVNLRFTHEPNSNLTIVTLIFPLTQAGAAMLTGEPEQPIDTFIDNGSHFSIAEAIADLVDAANRQNFGLTQQLIHRWSKKDPSICMNPLVWSAQAIVGTSYAEPEGALYAWTDVGFNALQGDADGDGLVEPDDRTAVEWYIALNDGSGIDADGAFNGRVTLADPGPNFSLFDITGDHTVSADDVSWFNFPSACPADWDRSGTIDVPDIFAFLSSWFSGFGDFDLNGLNEVPDIFAFLSSWFTGPCI